MNTNVHNSKEEDEALSFPENALKSPTWIAKQQLPIQHIEVLQEKMLCWACTQTMFQEFRELEVTERELNP